VGVQDVLSQCDSDRRVCERGHSDVSPSHAHEASMSSVGAAQRQRISGRSEHICTRHAARTHGECVLCVCV
jgi:hypothetical protein